MLQEELEEDAEAEQEMQQEAPELDSLDRVIMAAALVEKAETENTSSELMKGNEQVCKISMLSSWAVCCLPIIFLWCHIWDCIV